MNLVLERYCYGHVLPFRLPTLGRLQVGEHLLFSLEDPWNGNRPFDSCVPDGLYDLVPHHTAKHPDTWALVNPELGVYRQPSQIPEAERGKARFACLIHAGNYESDVEGCIAPGMGVALADGRLMVTRSQTAMALIRKTLGPGPHTLLIRSFRGAHGYE